MKNLILRICLLCALASPALASVPYFNASATNTAVLVRAASTTAFAGIVSLDAISAANPNAAAVYIQFFDSATAVAVTPGTTAPLFVIMVPAAANGVLNAAFPRMPTFSNGLVYAVTTTAAGGTAPAMAVPLTILFE